MQTVNFALMDELLASFLKRLFFRLLVKSSPSAVEEQFRPVAAGGAKLELFSQGLQLFFEVSLRPEQDFADSAELPQFLKKLSVVRNVFGGAF